MEAFVTLATSDSYATGALVLGHSIRSHGTTRQLVVLVTPGVSQEVRDSLAAVFDLVEMVDLYDSKDTVKLALLKRPELGVTFTKLHCWRLTQYTKCVFLDADTLALQTLDELFSEPELSACCDVGWPDCFNSGMFVFVPSHETYNSLSQMAQDEGSFDGGDQGLLNSFFPKWNRVSFIYNMVASATYTYQPAFQKFGKDVRLVHFLGSQKPWHGESVSSRNTTYDGYVRAWWTIYRSLVKPSLPSHICDLPSSSAAFVPHQSFHYQNIHSGQANVAAHHQMVDQLAAVSLSESLADSKARWEQGTPDYMGADSFDNILEYINKKVSK